MYGHVLVTLLTVQVVLSKLVVYGRIRITNTQQVLHSVVTNMSGIGRENHAMMLDHYQQTKCLLVSYDKEAQGFF